MLRTTSRECRQCGLCKNQQPLVQRQRGRSDVFFTGLSAVPTTDVDSDEPFSAGTRSGKLLRDIAGGLSAATVYYTNLVKCLPLQQDRIRYPMRSELELCFRFYQAELADLLPSKVVLFGRQVSGFVADKLGLRFGPQRGVFDFRVAKLGNTEFMAAHHPSYVLVYKHRSVRVFKDRITAFVEA